MRLHYQNEYNPVMKSLAKSPHVNTLLEVIQHMNKSVTEVVVYAQTVDY